MYGTPIVTGFFLDKTMDYAETIQVVTEKDGFNMRRRRR